MTSSSRTGISRLTLIGMAAAVVIVAILSFGILREPLRERAAQDDQRSAAIDRAIQLYATNCVECHGAFGEGLNQNGALNTAAVREQAYDDLFKTIERGRLNTAMIGYGDERRRRAEQPGNRRLGDADPAGIVAGRANVAGGAKPDPDRRAASRSAVRRRRAVSAAGDGQRGLGHLPQHLYLLPHLERDRRDQPRHRQKSGR